MPRAPGHNGFHPLHPAENCVYSFPGDPTTCPKCGSTDFSTDRERDLHYIQEHYLQTQNAEIDCPQCPFDTLKSFCNHPEPVVVDGYGDTPRKNYTGPMGKRQHIVEPEFYCEEPESYLEGDDVLEQMIKTIQLMTTYGHIESIKRAIADEQEAEQAKELKRYRKYERRRLRVEQEQADLRAREVAALALEQEQIGRQHALRIKHRREMESEGSDAVNPVSTRRPMKMPKRAEEEEWDRARELEKQLEEEALALEQEQIGRERALRRKRKRGLGSEGSDEVNHSSSKGPMKVARR